MFVILFYLYIINNIYCYYIYIAISTFPPCKDNISSRFSRNSEADASEFRDIL